MSDEREITRVLERIGTNRNPRENRQQKKRKEAQPKKGVPEVWDPQWCLQKMLE